VKTYERYDSVAAKKYRVSVLGRVRPSQLEIAKIVLTNTYTA